MLEDNAEDFVDAFYRHLLAFPETRALLADPAVKERLLGKQRNYLLSLADPALDRQRLARHLPQLSHRRTG